MLEEHEFKIENYGEFLEEISEGRIILLLDKGGELALLRVVSDDITEEQQYALEKVLLVTGSDMSLVLRFVLFVDLLWVRIINWFSERL